MNTASALLRQTHSALSFANRVRGSLGYSSISELPEPDLGYGASSCPLAIAFGGFDNATVSVTGKDFITSDQALADALVSASGNQAVYSYGSYVVPAPKDVTNFVNLFDTIYALENEVDNLRAQLQRIADTAVATVGLTTDDYIVF